MEFGPFEELISGDGGFERLARDKEVLVARLRRTDLAGRPGARKPELGVAFEQRPRYGSLADTTRTDNDDDEPLTGQER